MASAVTFDSFADDDDILERGLIKRKAASSGRKTRKASTVQSGTFPLLDPALMPDRSPRRESSYGNGKPRESIFTREFVTKNTPDGFKQRAESGRNRSTIVENLQEKQRSISRAGLEDPTAGRVYTTLEKGRDYGDKAMGIFVKKRKNISTIFSDPDAQDVADEEKREELLKILRKYYSQQRGLERIEFDMLAVRTGSALCKWLSHHPPDVQQAFVRACQISQFPAKHTVCRQGDDALEFFVVLKGRIDVKVLPPPGRGGKTKTVATLGPGSTFGDLAIISGCKRTASCITTEPCEVLILSSEKFLEIIHKPGQLYDPENMSDQKTMKIVWWRKHVRAVQGIPDEVIHDMMIAASVQRFTRGQEVQLDTTSLLYFMKHGTAEIIHKAYGRKLSDLKEGHFFGEASLFNLDQSHWSARMESAVECLVIPHNYLKNPQRVPPFIVDRMKMEADLRYTYCSKMKPLPTKIGQYRSPADRQAQQQPYPGYTVTPQPMMAAFGGATQFPPGLPRPAPPPAPPAQAFVDHPPAPVNGFLPGIAGAMPHHHPMNLGVRAIRDRASSPSRDLKNDRSLQHIGDRSKSRPSSFFDMPGGHPRAVSTDGYPSHASGAPGSPEPASDNLPSLTASIPRGGWNTT